MEQKYMHGKKDEEVVREESTTPTTPKFVSWVVFVWSLLIITTMFGYLFYEVRDTRAYTDSVKDSSQIESTKIETQLSQIQTDLSWIKTELSKR